jgi:drug/metabolite transporter (DMT)-like permease
MILTATEAVLIKKIILASSTLTAFISWCCFGAFFSYVLALINKLKVGSSIKNFGKDKITKLLLLVVCIGTMQLTTTYSFDHMPVAYALALFQLSTIVSVWMGHSFFQEKDIRKKLIGAFIMIIGSVIIILLK